MAKEAEQAPGIDLRAQMYDTLQAVREPSTEEQKEFEARSYVFLPVEPKTLLEVVIEDPDYFWSGELGYVRSIQQLAEYRVPVAMQVGVNPDQLWVPESFSKNRPTQLTITAEFSRSQVESVHSDARGVMLPSTALAQLDKAYKQRTGSVLFTNRFSRALDDASDVRAARVGRGHPGSQLRVSGWNPDDGNPRLGVVSAVVLTGNRK